VIVDKSLRGWKEIEYEVVRDRADNCITVCNMENFDPLGIHTGDSIVVAPSQTLSNDDYYMLRSAAIRTIRHLKVVGECNIQYALDPLSKNYVVIEVNARLSRSSALASKATGYPLAYVAAKLALGRTLPMIKNSLTKVTQACFEPALDYCVVKIPRWDLKKFNMVDFRIGSAMKSVGEVMAIDRNFEAAMSKALRMVNDHCDGFGYVPSKMHRLTNEQMEKELQYPSDMRVFAIALALKRGYSVNQIHDLTKIDRWFLCKLRNICAMEQMLSEYQDRIDDMDPFLLQKAKQLGFSDLQIARCIKTEELYVRNVRQRHHIVPFVKQIDTLAAEFPAFTNYLYLTYNATQHDLEFDENGVMILGCGAYRIGSSCEFDWCAVSAIRCLMSLSRVHSDDQFYSSDHKQDAESRRNGHAYTNPPSSRSDSLKRKKNPFSSIVVNYNPETVSTDYDECDRLYFEELSFERVLDIYEVEQSCGVIVSVGGQISNNLAMPLYQQGVRILGTQPDSIDNAENRHRFSKLLDRLHIDQPTWCEARAYEEALEFAEHVGFPVLIRPSYVLSGAAMNIVTNKDDFKDYLEQATNVSREHPVVISKFITNAKEIEMDAVAKNGVILNYAISEHIENAGVHSGDATLVLPAQNLYVETTKRVKRVTMNIAHALNITGPFNIQFLCKDNDIKVIECNLRASRSFPFVSKTFNVNFIDLATRAILEELVSDSATASQMVNLARPVNFNLFDMDYGADPVLRVEMASTGEVACFGDNSHEALLKSLTACNQKLPVPNPDLATSRDSLRLDYIYEDMGIPFDKIIHQKSSSVSGTASPKREIFIKSTNFEKVFKSQKLTSLKSDTVLLDDKSLIAFLEDESKEELESRQTQLSSQQQKDEHENHSTDTSELKQTDILDFSIKFTCNILLTIGGTKPKFTFLESAQTLIKLGYKLHATEGTHQFLIEHRIPSILVPKPSSGLHPNAIDLIERGDIHLVINVPGHGKRTEHTDGYHIRRKAVDYHVALVSNIKLAKSLVKALAKKYMRSYDYPWDSQFIHIKSWREYMSAAHRALQLGNVYWTEQYKKINKMKSKAWKSVRNL
ncbi:hypothetical protein RFI_12503, partial [Reticulomyxa filosa]